MVRSGAARLGRAWRGMARFGGAGFGKARNLNRLKSKGVKWVRSPPDSLV